MRLRPNIDAASVMKFVDCSGDAKSVSFYSETHNVGLSWWNCRHTWVNCWWYDSFVMNAKKGANNEWYIDTEKLSKEDGGGFTLIKNKEYRWKVNGVTQVSGAGNNDDTDQECSDIHGNYRVPNAFETKKEHTDYMQNYGETKKCAKSCDTFKDTCLCDNGTPATGAACPSNYAVKCASCDAGFKLIDDMCAKPVTDAQLKFLPGDWQVEPKQKSIINAPDLHGAATKSDNWFQVNNNHLSTRKCFFDGACRTSASSEHAPRAKL